MSRANTVRCDACQKEVPAEEAGDWWTVTVGRSTPGTAPAETSWGHGIQAQPYLQQVAGDACSKDCVGPAAAALATTLTPPPPSEPPTAPEPPALPDEVEA